MVRLRPALAGAALVWLSAACVSASPEPEARPAPTAVDPGAGPRGAEPISDELFVGHGDAFRVSDLERWVAEAESMSEPAPSAVARPDSVGHTLLHRAAIAGRADLARRLISLGADPNALSIFAYTPLDLIQQGAGPKDRRGLDEVVELLISAGGGYHYYAGGARHFPKSASSR